MEGGVVCVVNISLSGWGYLFIMIDPSSIPLHGKQPHPPHPSFSSSTPNNPQNLLSRAANNDDQDFDFDSLPTNLQLAPLHIKTSSSQPISQDNSQQMIHRPQTTFMQTRYWQNRYSPLSEIMECNNESSSIIFHPTRRGSLVKMPDIAEERGEFPAARAGRSRQLSFEEKEIYETETAASEMKSKLVEKIGSSVNVRTVVVGLLLVLMVFTMFLAFGGTEPPRKKASRRREEREEAIPKRKGRKQGNPK